MNALCMAHALVKFRDLSNAKWSSPLLACEIRLAPEIYSLLPQNFSQRNIMPIHTPAWNPFSQSFLCDCACCVANTGPLPQPAGNGTWAPVSHRIFLPLDWRGGQKVLPQDLAINKCPIRRAIQHLASI